MKPRKASPATRKQLAASVSQPVEAVLARPARVRGEPERGHGEQQVARRRGDPVPGADQQHEGGDGPRPSDAPRKWGRRAARSFRSPRSRPASRAAGPRWRPWPGRSTANATGTAIHQPPMWPCPDGDPDRRRVRRLVADVRGADPVGVEEQVPPVEPRRVRRDEAAGQPARRRTWPPRPRPPGSAWPAGRTR